MLRPDDVSSTVMEPSSRYGEAWNFSLDVAL